MSAVRDEHLLVFAAGTVVRAELDKNQVRAGGVAGASPDAPDLHVLGVDRGEVFFPVQQLGVARDTEANNGYPRNAASGASARRTSRRAPHGCCSSMAITSFSCSSIKRVAKPSTRSNQSLLANGSLVGTLTWCKRVNVGTRLFLPSPGTSSTCGPMTAFSAPAFCSQLVDAALDLGRIHAPIERMSRIAAKKPPAIPEISSGSWPLAPHSRPAHSPADKTAKPVAP